MSEIKKNILAKFRAALPASISDTVVSRIVEESVSRTKEILRNEPSYLLGEEIKVEVSEYWNGDVQVHGGGIFGINWVFDKKTGRLHTT